MTTIPLPTCDTPDCPGHLGKFSSCIAEALYSLAVDSGQDDSAGEVEFGYHVDLFTLTEEWAESLPEDDQRANTVPAGNYCLYTYESGRVALETFDTEADARRCLESVRADWDAWSDRGDLA